MSYSTIVKRNDKIKLREIDPGKTQGLSKEERLKQTEELGVRMGELQELLFAAGSHALLIVLQGMDTSGKDGAIRHILNYTNVQSCRVAPFKVPTENELRHDFLWRVHSHTPGRGEVAIFNRSHYEDVLVVRVHNIVPKSVWEARYELINDFEKLVSSGSTIILKFFLHISKDEQEERLLEREKDTTKAWKLSVGDWQERKLWDDYQGAYEDAINKCSTDEAPWRIIPANHKWFRNLAISEAIVEALSPFRKDWMSDLEQIGQKAKQELEIFRQSEK